VIEDRLQLDPSHVRQGRSRHRRVVQQVLHITSRPQPRLRRHCRNGRASSVSGIGREIGRLSSA
jgi:hypothetical protein